MAHRIEVIAKEGLPEARIVALNADLSSAGFKDVEVVGVSTVYTVDRDFDSSKLEVIADSLSNPVVHEHPPHSSAISAIEVWKLRFLKSISQNPQ